MNTVNSTSNDLSFIFANEPKQNESIDDKNCWLIMIVDDEPAVHEVTERVLREFVFEEKGLRFIHAFSVKQAQEFISNYPDTAIVLLDVVMETDDAGLQFVKYIRDTVKNRFVRIILRTGQPGKAPEKQVIISYDINDYKAKTELSAMKLFTTIITALRSYRDLRIIEKHRKGLEQIIESTAQLFEFQRFKQFAKGVLLQLMSILHLDAQDTSEKITGIVVSKINNTYIIQAGTGEYEGFENESMENALPVHIQQMITSTFEEKHSFFYDHMYIGYLSTRKDIQNVLFLSGCRMLTELDRDLIRIYAGNVSIAFENLYLNQEIIGTQKEVIFTLGEVVETRSNETANHVRRVAEFSYRLAELIGFNEEQAKLLRLASPMHDIGKIAIPDAILFKPGALTPKEFEIIKSHTTVGYRILKNSDREIMNAAAIVALEHHERWDGTGYPQQLKSTQINIIARLTCIVDVFDALFHNRCYRKAWPLEKIIDYIKEMRASLFDPNLTDIFLNHIDEFVQIKTHFPDESE
ncbi:MAG: DUF3369 domain-containing protein [Desulfobacterales bacterium]|nr:DUF3369 domain-containing protein [Desulfobacterales bacterium]